MQNLWYTKKKGDCYEKKNFSFTLDLCNTHSFMYGLSGLRCIRRRLSNFKRRRRWLCSARTDYNSNLRNCACTIYSNNANRFTNT